MNNLHDARAWDLVRRLANYRPQNTPAVFTALRDDARALIDEASELEEAKRMIAHLQSIRLGLLEAAQALLANLEDSGDRHADTLRLKNAVALAKAGKIPPQVQTVKILGETPIQWRDLP